jgi:hypothetical protein
MLVGEPGIGKTRTVAELETYARMRAAKVLWGRAHESSGAPPYWPWVQVARAYREDTPDELRRKQYEPYAAELQRIFPGLRDLFRGLPEPPAETEEGQFRLFDAFSAFARSGGGGDTAGARARRSALGGRRDAWVVDPPRERDRARAHPGMRHLSRH